MFEYMALAAPIRSSAAHCRIGGTRLTPLIAIVLNSSVRSTILQPTVKADNKMD